jgi:hypothetical protein
VSVSYLNYSFWPDSIFPCSMLQIMVRDDVATNNNGPRLVTRNSHRDILGDPFADQIPDR